MASVAKQICNYPNCHYDSQLNFSKRTFFTKPAIGHITMAQKTSEVNMSLMSESEIKFFKLKLLLPSLKNKDSLTPRKSKAKWELFHIEILVKICFV